MKGECVSVAVKGPTMDKEKLLGDDSLEKGTGTQVGAAVKAMINEWDLASKIIAINFDTCSVNTGRDLGKLTVFSRNRVFLTIHYLCLPHKPFHLFILGACSFIEREAMGRAVMWWPCLHHILELVLKGVVQSRWPTKGPSEALYLRFQKEWPSLQEKMPDIMARGKEKVNKEFVIFITFVTFLLEIVQQLFSMLISKKLSPPLPPPLPLSLSLSPGCSFSS